MCQHLFDITQFIYKKIHREITFKYVMRVNKDHSIMTYLIRYGKVSANKAVTILKRKSKKHSFQILIFILHCKSFVTN